MTSPAPVKITQEDLPNVYDEAFTIKTQRWGTFVSQDLKGTNLVTSLSEGGCIASTRWYLKGLQEGFPETVAKYDSSAAGKL